MLLRKERGTGLFDLTVWVFFGDPFDNLSIYPPVFITDDDDAHVPLATMPGQCRWGVNKLEGFLGPLVKKGLQSVIIFGVPLKVEKVSCR